MLDAGHADDPAVRPDALKQQSGEREVTEVVRVELAVKFVLRPAQRNRHHARVVDEQVDRREAGGQRVDEPADRRRAGEIERQDAQGSARKCVTNLFCDRLPFVGAAARHHYRRPVARRRARRFPPQATVGTGHHGNLTVEIRHILLRPSTHVVHRNNWSCPCNSGHADTVRLMTPQHV